MNEPRISFVGAVTFFVLSIGAKDCIDFGGSVGTSAPPPSPPPKPFCLTDPPLGCAAFCSAVGMVSVTPQCHNIEASTREFDFETIVANKVIELEGQGIQVCPEATPTSVITPCAVGVFPVEHPNQDHEFCQTPPLDCSL